MSDKDQTASNGEFELAAQATDREADKKETQLEDEEKENNQKAQREQQTEWKIKYQQVMVFNVVLIVIIIIMIIAIAATSAGGFINNQMTFEPSLPAMMHKTDRPRLIFAQDINYPPYAVLTAPPVGLYKLGGFGREVAEGVAKICDWDMTFVETNWNKCWDNGYAGDGMLKGSFHGCMTYTHTNGKRNRMLEFSNSILKSNKPGGLLGRIRNGMPEISGMDDLSGKTIADVRGWAPTDDGMQYNNNTCTGTHFKNFNMIIPEVSGNDHALSLLLNNKVDAVWIYADQAAKFNCEKARKDEVNINWDCNMWDQFGQTFAYIHTGFMDQNVNGTTLTMSRKGSGLNDIVNPCLQKYLRTEDYYKLCKEYDGGSLYTDCFKNEYFDGYSAESFESESEPAVDTNTVTVDTSDYKDYSEAGIHRVLAGGHAADHHWFTPTNKLKTQCTDGYCPC